MPVQKTFEKGKNFIKNPTSLSVCFEVEHRLRQRWQLGRIEQSREPGTTYSFYSGTPGLPQPFRYKCYMRLICYTDTKLLYWVHTLTGYNRSVHYIMAVLNLHTYKIKSTFKYI